MGGFDAEAHFSRKDADLKSLASAQNRRFASAVDSISPDLRKASRLAREGKMDEPEDF